MERIAYISAETTVYWSGIVLTLAAAAAMSFFLAFYLNKSGNAPAAFAALPICAALGIVLGRFFHWYSRADSYDGFLSAITDYSSGGYALWGVFLGCFLAAALLRLLRLHKNLPEMLDCMALAGLPGIAVGRLASFFNASDRGQVVSFTSLPVASPVTNSISGATDYRFATFLFQAIIALTLFVILAVFYLRGCKKGTLRDGDACLIMLMCYGSSQVVMDSSRYDSLFFRSNGFVSIVQVLGALGLGLAIVVFSRRLVKGRGFRFWYVLVWILMAAAIGGAGFMEYYVQRHGNEALFAYSVMSACLILVVALTLWLRGLAENPRRAR